MEKNLQQITRVTWGICLHKKFDPRGLSALAPGLYMYKHEKLCIKSDFKDIFFETCNKWASDKAFLLTSGFCPQRVVCPCPGAIYMWKNIKNMCINQNSKTFVWNLQQMVEVIRAFCWHQKFVPKGFSALAPGLYTCIKSLKVCIKSDCEEIILKLATYGQREKAFLLSSKFCPQGVVCPCPGATCVYTCIKAFKYIPGPDVRWAFTGPLVSVITTTFFGVQIVRIFTVYCKCLILMKFWYI